MTKFSRTWWGQKFIAALEDFTDKKRLQRGRSYSGDNRILHFEVTNGLVLATIRGNVNAYFGVYKEPKYQTQIKITPITNKDWEKIIQHLSAKASVVAKLLLNEIPENIENSFLEVGKHFLPHSRKDWETTCSCPDYENPCKHIAGLCYRLASELDQNPWLLFEMRGISKETLQQELAKSPLGKALAAELSDRSLDFESSDSYFTAPILELATENSLTLKQFWHGQKRLPQSIPFTPPSPIPGIVVKKQGDYPPFWQKDDSFLEVMDEFYDRVKAKNSSLF